jgi:hypothetical protein
MPITARILILAISLLLISCTEWGPAKKASRPVDLFSDVQESGTENTIPINTLCKIDQRISVGKVYGFHKIECRNGQFGYVMIGDANQAFTPTH